MQAVMTGESSDANPGLVKKGAFSRQMDQDLVKGTSGAIPEMDVTTERACVSKGP